ncbi:AimR family lysis-lysogeny pheromone receptor [Aquibacillus sp. 3ASR75-54]|uniref:AimR family lysis-lysogeny pheromone receptor n=1 Tax=Aquibacillus salsiterrae TaxID=2950439 RepID=A0A9X3WBP4_9BACI|nr:AimR family lysis-lysogeny pheromone receptor [Aquibacillus salsiterrae]MDC3416720.1 AimR family lysis-lysogeny pheromone receptor [Aquibacillus salsiterrae]
MTIKKWGRDMLDSYLSQGRSLYFHEYISLVSMNCDEKTVIEMAKRFCDQTMIEDNWIVGMEFFYMNGNMREVDKLIERNKQSGRDSNQSFATVYQVMVDLKRNLLSPPTAIELLDSVKINSPALYCIVTLAKVSIHYSTHQFAALGYYIDKINQYLNQINNPLLVTLYKVRMDALLFIYYWKRNELILGRKHAFRAIKQTFHLQRKFIAFIHL